MIARTGASLMAGVLLASSIVFAETASASDLQVVAFEAPGANVQMTSYFTSPGSVSPGGPLFSYVRELKGSSELAWTVAYYFAGRTGENTFELLRRASETGPLASPPRERKISAYFDRETPIPLSILGPMTDAACAAEEVPQLKMVRLAGNTLQAQVLLPACLVNAVNKR
ncbi:hypothetical protein D9M68_100280 [compost metagenome]